MHLQWIFLNNSVKWFRNGKKDKESVYRKIRYLVNKSISTSQAQSVHDTSSLINDLSYFESNSIVKNIPRQSVYNWIRNWYVPNIVPKSV